MRNYTDAFDAPESSNLLCHTCGAHIDDETTARVDAFASRWFCADCVEAERRENDAPAFDADDPRSKPMSAYAAGLFEAFGGKR